MNTQPAVQVVFPQGGNVNLTDEIMSVYLRDMSQAMQTSRGNIEELTKWQKLLKEARFLNSFLLDEAINGNKESGDKDTLPPVDL